MPAEHAERENHREIQPDRAQRRHREPAEHVQHRREERGDADHRHVGHAQRREPRREAVPVRVRSRAEKFREPRERLLRQQRDADRRRRERERQREHPRRRARDHLIEKAERARVAAAGALLRHRGHERARQRAFAEEPPEKIRNLKRENERRGDRARAEEARRELVAEESEHARARRSRRRDEHVRVGCLAGTHRRGDGMRRLAARGLRVPASEARSASSAPA